MDHWMNWRGTSRVGSCRGEGQNLDELRCKSLGKNALVTVYVVMVKSPWLDWWKRCEIRVVYTISDKVVKRAQFRFGTPVALAYACEPIDWK